MQLRDAHKCNKCREIVHPLCVSMGDFENPTCDLCVYKEKIVEPQDSSFDNQQEVCSKLTSTASQNVVCRKTNNETERSPQPRRNSPRNVVPATPREISSNSKSLTPKASRNRTRRRPSIKSTSRIIIPAEVPAEIQEKNSVNNCLISTITNSVIGDTRYIPKDYFYNKKQKINQMYKKSDGEKWESLRSEIETEIETYLQLKMVRRAQELDLKVGEGEESKLVTSLNEIGLAFKDNGSPEVATKMNVIFYEDFKIRSGYEYYTEVIIMKKLNLKYSDEEENSNKGSIARMIVNRKCNICKVINNRVMNTHQNKVRRKRKPSEVKMMPERYAEQSFAFGDEGWFTSDGKQFEVSDESPKKKLLPR